MDPYTTANIFDLVMTIAKSLISFAQIFYNFITMPMSTVIVQIGFIKDVPLLGSFLIKALGFISPYTPLDIMAGGGFLVLIVLVIIKKVVPIA
jgi:hypothetical protein